MVVVWPHRWPRELDRFHAAYRVAEAQLRRREKESPQGEPDFNRIPAMAMARDEVVP